MLIWENQFDDRDLQERSTSDCPTGTYTAPDGLEFEMFCGQDIGSYDLEQTQADDVIDCMDQCSLLRPPCYAVAFANVTGECFLKNASVTLEHLGPTDGSQSALAHSSQLRPLNTDCPYSNNSIQATTDGMEFEIFCGLDVGGDYCPDTGATCPHHADTLGECMESCSKAHPLCTGVAFNPDLSAGYANCYLKNQPEKPYPSTLRTTHTALARLPQANVSCPSNPKIASSNSKPFDLTCNMGRSGSSNFSSYHDFHLEGCINTCATSGGQNCVGIVFDASMIDGFENCYLLNSTGVPATLTDTTFALLLSSSSTPSPSPSPTHSSALSSGSSHSYSKAWIAGPVIGALLAIALLVGLIFWRRRLSTTKQQSDNITSSLDYNGVHQGYSGIQQGYSDVPQCQPKEEAHPLYQLPDQSTNTHEIGPSREARHELES